jgi:hypothetical protein
MTQYSLRPLADNELEVVSGGMSSTFQYGSFKMAVSAGADWNQVAWTDGTTSHVEGTSKSSSKTCNL